MGGGRKKMSFVATSMGADEKSNSLTMGLTDKEIDERVSVCFPSHCPSIVLIILCVMHRLPEP